MRGIGVIVSGENTGGLVTLDGHAAGEAPAALVLAPDGARHIGLQPDAPRFYGVTRRLTFEGGRLADCPADVKAYAWAGGLYEILLRCGELPPPRERRFPYVAARAEFAGAVAVLYYEDGLWLSIERGGRVQTGFPLSETAETGALHIRGGVLFALAQGARDVCLALDGQLMPLGSIEADTVRYGEEGLVSTEALPSLCGYERRTRWEAADGALTAAETRTGFFTHAETPCDAGMRFLEALLYGDDSAAAARLSPRLGAGLAQTRAFLGDFSLVRAHPANRHMYGVAPFTEGVTQLRTLTLETEGEQILNILEQS